MVGVPYNSRQQAPTNGPNRAQKQRRFRPEPELAPNNEIAYDAPGGDTWDELALSDNPILSTIGTGARSFTNASRQFGSNVVSGALQIPTDVAGMVDLVRHGVPSIIAGANDDTEEDDNYFQRVGQHFMNGIFTPEAQQELAVEMQGVIEAAQAQKPDMTEQDVDALLNAYQNTDDYFDSMTQKMSPGFRLAQWGNKWANDVVGLGKRPDQQTTVDELEQILGQSIIGLPASITRGIAGRVRGFVGDTIADNMVSKIALRAAEVASPITFPLTPANAALNTGVGTAINETIRGVQQQPGLVHGQIAEFTPEEIAEVPEFAQMTPNEARLSPVEGVEPADGHGTDVEGQVANTALAGGVTLGAFFGLPAFRRGVTATIANKAKKAIDQTGLNAGPTQAEQANNLDPILSPAAGMADSQAPVRRGANQFPLTAPAAKYVTKGEMIDSMDAHLSTASPPNVHDSVVNVVNFGTLSNAPDTIPLATIRRAASTLPEPDLELLNKYAIAKQRAQDFNVQRLTLDDDMRAAWLDAQSANARGDKKAEAAAMKRFTDKQTEKADLLADTEASRPNMQTWTRADVDEIIKVAELNPNVMGIANMMQKSGRDMLDYALKNGYYDSKTVQRFSQNRDFFVPMRERAYAEMTDPDNAKHNPLLRKGMLLRDRIFPKGRKDEYVPIVPEGKINHPKDPIIAQQEAWSELVRSVTANNARRQVIDTLRMFDGAEGKMFRQWEHKGRKSFSAEEFYNPKTGLQKLVDESPVPLTRVVRNGNFEFYEFSDPSITRALDFAPIAAVPIFNATRKFWQNFTTGAFAPWFAVKALTWDIGVARTTMKNGRSLGLVDTWSRRMANESRAVNAVMDHVPDFTAPLSVAWQVPYAVSMRGARAAGHKIADDLALNSGVFGMIAKVPGAKPLLDDMGTWMVKQFDRSVFNVYNRNLSTHMGLLQENAKIVDDYNAIKTRLGPMTEARRNLWNGYKSIIESVQGATRMAFFAENYGRLTAANGGKVPKAELAKLVKETRDLSGDMSKFSGNKAVQVASSVFPYANAAIQGTRHILGATIPPSVAKGVNKLTGGKANLVEERSNRFWSQFTGGVVLPAIGSAAIMSQWEGAEEYIWNKLPEWRRLTTIVMPSGEALYEYLSTGQWPEFSPDKLTYVELAPELSMLLNPMMAGLQALGIAGKPARSVPQMFGGDIGAAFRQLVSVANPPLFDLAMRSMGVNVELSDGSAQEVNTLTHGGANADMRAYNSDMSKMLYDVIGSLASSSGQIFAQTFDVFDMTLDETDDFGAAMDQAFDTFGYEVGRRFPDIPLLFNTADRQYAFTPESEYVFKTERTLDPLIGSGRQQSVETDSKDREAMLEAQGLTPPQKITDPLLKAVSQTVYNSLRKKGVYKAATEQYSDLRVTLNALEASRTRWPAEAYHAKYNEIVSAQQQLKQIQAQELQTLLTELQEKVGPLYEAQYGVPLSYESLSELVRQNVSN